MNGKTFVRKKQQQGVYFWYKLQTADDAAACGKQMYESHSHMYIRKYMHDDVAVLSLECYIWVALSMGGWFIVAHRSF